MQYFSGRDGDRTSAGALRQLLLGNAKVMYLDKNVRSMTDSD